MKLSAAQVFGRVDEDEALTDHGSPPPVPPFARPPQSPPPPPPSFATAALAADTYQPARVAGSDGTLTIGSAEVVRAPKACTCVSPNARILRVQLRIKEPRNESGSTLMSQKWPSRGSKRTFLPLLEAQNVHFSRCAAEKSKGWAFHCKGGSARKTRLDFWSFHPIIPFCCTLSDPESDTRVRELNTVSI
eukprot:scaffold16601_cov53-Phaeocystis_antarctica.AAC.1